MAAGGLKLVFEVVSGSAKDVFEAIGKPFAVASTRAMDRLKNDVKTQGRAEIGRGGFSQKWKNALRVDRFPTRGASINAALWIWHKIPYAGIFETGGTIHGHPLLWVPLASMPKKIGGKRPSPRSYKAAGNKLIYVDRGSAPPLLVGKPPSGFRKGRTKASKSLHARYANSALAPLFIGLDVSRIRKRFALQKVFEAVSNRLVGYFDQEFKDE